MEEFRNVEYFLRESFPGVESLLSMETFRSLKSFRSLESSRGMALASHRMG
jgi:hypothetical protein